MNMVPVVSDNVALVGYDHTTVFYDIALSLMSGEGIADTVHYVRQQRPDRAAPSATG